jgi:dTDP-4-amino-4,6-dideoxygalactose transaminase
VGTIGDIGIFSLGRGKNMTASAYLRFPILVEDPERREEVYAALAYQHLGVSKTYPSALNGIRELMPCAVRNESAYPGAETVAKQILTLPTHPFVLQSDLGRVAALIRASR